MTGPDAVPGRPMYAQDDLGKLREEMSTMSITNDFKSYTGTAMEQGRQVFDQAQTQLTSVTGQATDFVGKVSDKVAATSAAATLVSKYTEIKTRAEKAMEPVLAPVMPYVTQVEKFFEPYVGLCRTKAEEFFDQVVAHPLVAKVDGRLVKPTLTLVKPTLTLVGLAPKSAVKSDTPVEPLVARKPTSRPRPTKVAAKTPAKPTVAPEPTL
jgi:hypothetical protein